MPVSFLDGAREERCPKPWWSSASALKFCLQPLETEAEFRPWVSQKTAWTAARGASRPPHPIFSSFSNLWKVSARRLLKKAPAFFLFKMGSLTGNVNTLFSALLLQSLKYSSDAAGAILHVCTSAEARSPTASGLESPELSAGPAPAFPSGSFRATAPRILMCGTQSLLRGPLSSLRVLTCVEAGSRAPQANPPVITFSLHGNDGQSYGRSPLRCSQALFLRMRTSRQAQHAGSSMNVEAEGRRCRAIQSSLSLLGMREWLPVGQRLRLRNEPARGGRPRWLPPRPSGSFQAL